jgi:hypothetical protein
MRDVSREPAWHHRAYSFRGSITLIILGGWVGPQCIVALTATIVIGCRGTKASEHPRLDLIDVRKYGASGDGRTDDTDAILRATTAACERPHGGVLYFASGRYRFTRTIRLVGVRCSNVVIEGAGPSTILDFQPDGAAEDTFNDRAIYIESGVTPPHQIVAPIAVADRSFIVSDPAVANRLRPGQWVVVSERDSGAKEIVIIDWAQVDHVTGTRVHVRHPFRTHFPGERPWRPGQSGLGFQAVHSLLENVTIRNLQVVHAARGRTIALVNIGMALRTRLHDVLLDNANGNGIALYRAKDVGIENLTVVNSVKQANEIAATVDFRVSTSSFGFEFSAVTKERAADTAALNIDFGSAFFTISGNSIQAAGNIGVMFLDGVHDGVFSNNTVGWVRDADIGLGQGVSARGTQRVLLQGNSFAGGDRGKGNTCVTFADSSELEVPIASSGNLIQANLCAGFEHETGVRLRADRYL